MDIFEAIDTRRSVRKYKKGASIPKTDIEKLLSAAMHAPSAVNSRPWEFYCTDKEVSKPPSCGRTPPAVCWKRRAGRSSYVRAPNCSPATVIGRRIAPRRSKISCSPPGAWATAPAGAAAIPPSRARTT